MSADSVWVRRGVLLVVAVAGALLMATAAAYACTALATMEFASPSGDAGSFVQGTGKGFRASHGGAEGGPVEIRFNRRDGQVLWLGHPQDDGTITFGFTAPQADAGHYVIVAVQKDLEGRDVYGTPARQSFEITGAAASAAGASAPAAVSADEPAPAAAAPTETAPAQPASTQPASAQPASAQPAASTEPAAVSAPAEPATPAATTTATAPATPAGASAPALAAAPATQPLVASDAATAAPTAPAPAQAQQSQASAAASQPSAPGSSAAAPAAPAAPADVHAGSSGPERVSVAAGMERFAAAERAAAAEAAGSLAPAGPARTAASPSEAAAPATAAAGGVLEMGTAVGLIALTVLVAFGFAALARRRFAGPAVARV